MKKESLESVIAKAIESGLSPGHVLSEKAKKRIEKSAQKLGEKLTDLFEKEKKKALKNAGTKTEGETWAEAGKPADRAEDAE